MSQVVVFILSVKTCFSHEPGKPSICIGCLRLTTLLASGGCPPGFYLLWQSQVYWLAPEAPLFGRMSTELKAFLEPAMHLSFGLCSAPHIKTA